MSTSHLEASGANNDAGTIVNDFQGLPKEPPG